MWLWLILMIVIILLIPLGLLTPSYTQKVVEGAYSPNTLDSIMDYIEPYLLETDGKNQLHQYLVAHFDYKDAPEDLKDLIKKIVKEKEIKGITDFLEVSQLTYGNFISDKEKCELYANEIRYEVEPEDYDHLVREGRDLLSEMNLKYKYDDGELRRIFRKNMDRWKKLKFKRPTDNNKFELDKFAFRVYLRNYFRVSCLDEKKQLEELKRLVKDYAPSMYNVTSMNEMIRTLRELKDLKYLRADDNLDDVAIRFGLDPAVLSSYKKMYPGLTVEQIIREILSRKGANDITLKDSAFVEELLGSCETCDG